MRKKIKRKAYIIIIYNNNSYIIINVFSDYDFVVCLSDFLSSFDVLFYFFYWFILAL